MMAGVYPRSSALVAGVYTQAIALVGELDTRASALIGELAPPLRVGCWTSSGLHIITGSWLMMGRSAWTCGGVGAVGGTLPRSSVCSVWIVASSSSGASWTPSIAAVRHAVAPRILSVAAMLGTGMAWWQKWNVSVMRLPPVSAIKTRMQR
jgi:hypothetical protein